MQKIIFLCLLSLSVCLCGPVEQSTAKQATPAATSVTVPNAVPKTAEPSVPHAEAQPTAHTELTANQTATENATKQQQNATSPPATNKANETKEEAAKTVPKVEPTKQAEKETTPTKETKETTDSKSTEKGSKTEEATKSEASTEKAAGTTPKPVVSTGKPGTTVKPKADDADHPAVQTRKFDGPSFIGGIIMTLGLLAISFMGYKYYKNQTERNYHTL